MENLTLCEVCVCAPVCSRLMATGGVVSCEHFHSTLEKTEDEE